MKKKVLNEPPRAVAIFRWSCLFCSLIIGLLTSQRAECQTTQNTLVRVSGTVTDAKTKQAVPGINVYVKNQLQRGTATGIDGTYTLRIEPNSPSIIFSGVGYDTQEVKYTGQTTIDVKLKESVNELETVNVVSIGYGQQKREKIASSIVSITAEDLTDMPSPNFATLLQGKLPGVAINNWSGEPGVRNEVYIRGVGVVGNDRISTPLYVIDGIPMEQTQDATMLQRGTNTDPLSSINPNDIESVDILKDAAATAIYGSRGANGVILVKTKQGIKDRPIISYRTNLTINTVPQLQQTMGGRKERELKMKLWSNLKNNPDLPISVADSLNPFWNNSTDWQDQYYHSSFSQDHSLSISGGMKGITYRVSLGYTSDKGIMKSSDFERYTASTSTKYEPFKDFFIDLNVRMSRTNRSRPKGENNALNQNTGIGTDFPSSLIPSSNSDKMKLIQDAFELMEDKNIDNNIAPSLAISFAFLKDFRWNSSFSLSYTKSDRETFKPAALNGTESNGKPTGASINISNSGNQTYSMDHTLSYMRTFKEKHTPDIIIGFSQSMNESNNLYANATKGVTDAIHDLNGYTKDNTTTSSRYVAYGSQSFFARLQYDYDSKYIASVSWRADGSSRFGKNYRYAFFPSVALAYNLHREAFMKSADWINQMKIRWSWGITGTEAGISEYLSQGIYKTTYTSKWGESVSASTYNGQAVMVPDYSSGLANPDLTWEEAEQYNIGADFSLFNYRLNVTFDAFWKQSRDILFKYDLPDIAGYTQAYKNATELLNYGYEFSVTGHVFDPQTSKFTWSTTLLGAFTKNVVTKLPNGNLDISQYNSYNQTYNYLRVGRPANGFLVYKTNGIYATDADIPVNPYTGNKLYRDPSMPLQAGDQAIVDLDGNGRIYEVSGIGGFASSDRIFCGNPYPIVQGGWNNTFRYKEWSLEANFVYSIGREIMNMTTATKMVNILKDPNSNMYDYTQYNHWQKPGDQAEWPVLSPDRYKDQPSMYTTQYDRYIERADYLRLNNLRIGYDVNRDFLKQFKIRRLFVYAQATNLWTLTNYSGADPENVDMFGVDNGTQYARPRQFNFGLNVEF